MTNEERHQLIDSPRAALTIAIREHIYKERMEDSLKLGRAKRQDAIESMVKDAVRHSGIVAFNGIPHVWVKKFGIYVPFDYNALKIAVYDAMRKAGIPDGNYSGIERLVKLCWAEAQSNRRDIDTSIVVMKNGVFDTMDMSIHELGPQYMTNMRVGYEYNAKDVPVGWKNFLNRVLPDEEMQQMLQEFIAATYVNRKCAKIEHMLILLGSGANGKSVVFEVISAMLGEDNVSNFSVSDLIGSRREQCIAGANGKRLNYCSEIRTTEIGNKNADAFKALVSGEQQMARSLYCEPFCADAVPLLMANANAMPRMNDATYALQRRMLVLPFEVFIPEDEQDKELANTLKKELSGIFNWAMLGLERLRSNKYAISIPDRVREIVNEYVKDSNAMMRWLDEEGMLPHWVQSKDPEESWLPNAEIFAKWEQWRMRNGEPPRSRNAFYEAMDMLGFRRRRRSVGCGYSFFKVPGQEEILQLNLDLALKIQQKETADALRKQIEETGTMTVFSVADLEKYLGLPKDSIWAHMRNGSLRTCYKRLPDGKQIYDVKAVQIELARCGFYEKLNQKDSGLKKVAQNALRGLRKTFNNQMKMMGLPIRKHGNMLGYVPMADSECWFVPDDWEYSKRAAEIVMSRDKQFAVIDALAETEEI